MSGSRSQKMRRGHACLRQRNRRGRTERTTDAVPHGKSATVRAYRLWIAVDTRPQAGQAAPLRRDVTITVIPPSSMTTSSKSKPAPCGTHCGRSGEDSASRDGGDGDGDDGGCGMALLRRQV